MMIIVIVTMIVMTQWRLRCRIFVRKMSGMSNMRVLRMTRMTRMRRRRRRRTEDVNIGPSIA